MKHLLPWIAVLGLLLCGAAGAQADEPRAYRPLRADTSPALGELLRGEPGQEEVPADPIFKPREVPNRKVPPPVADPVLRQAAAGLLVQRETAGLPLPAPVLSVDGYANADNVAVAGGRVVPPDPNGDVGRDHYVQYLNVGFAVFSKLDGRRLAGPFAGNAFWRDFGGPCETDNAGDALVLYDELADRWVFAQFAEPVAAGGRQCLAVSVGGDPLGAYHRYEYALPFLDYPKLGLFSDGGAHSGYYLTTNNFGGTDGAYSGVTLGALDRDALLAGDPLAAIVAFDLPPSAERLYFAVQPPNLEGPLLPPPGSCAPFVMAWDDEIWASDPAPGDGYLLWSLCPDFDDPAASVLTGPLLADAGEDFDMEICGFGDCIPQPGTAQRLDSLSQFTMYRASLRVSPTDAPGALRMTVAVTVDTGGDLAGIRWAVLEPGPEPRVVEQGTFAPDARHRWVPSVAMDQEGNLGLGYSRSSLQEAPSIQLSGRSIEDPPGLLREERSCVPGGGVQTGSGRWVDYAAMSVDPVDGCTFWFTSEYYAQTSSLDWSTRICAFRFPGCGEDRVLLRALDESVRQQACVGAPLDPVRLEVDVSAPTAGPVSLALRDPGAAFDLALAQAELGVLPGIVTVSAALRATAGTGEQVFEVLASAPGLAEAVRPVFVEPFSDVPQVPPLELPADGLRDLELRPLFRWAAVPAATGYRVEVDDDPSFASPEAEAVVTATSWRPPVDLEPGVAYHWRVLALNPCGEAASPGRSFATVPPGASRVLLVDDDDNTPDVRTAFADALAANGLQFDVWDTNNSDAEPPAPVLADYAAVVWFTGDEFEAVTGPSPSSEKALGAFLERGGCLLLSSQDYAFRAIGNESVPNSFMQNYLGVAEVNGDVGYSRVTGLGAYRAIAEAELDYRAVSIALSLAAFNDDLQPGPGGATALEGQAGSVLHSAAVASTGDDLRSLYLGFPLPALPPEDRRELVRAFVVERCGVLEGLALGELAGTVRTAGSGAAIPGARVLATRAGTTFQAVADEAGRYRFGALPAGFFQVQAQAPLAAPSAPVQNLEVRSDETASLDFTLDGPEATIAGAQERLVARVPRGGRAAAAVRLANPGTRDLQFAAAVSGYALGPEPSLEPAAPRGGVLEASSRGAAARPAALSGGASRGAAGAGDDPVLFSAPFPDPSPLGITMAPDGSIWVADLFSGRTARYDPELTLLGIIDDPVGIPPESTPTTGIAYDPLADSLWWLASDGPELVEGSRDGTATGRSIALTVSDAGLAAGVEYDPLADAFFYLDIVADDIWAVDRDGRVLPGYPVPQTSYDQAGGLFGNGLDVVGDKLEVLLGLPGSNNVSRAVLTDRFGNDLGLETPLEGVGDSFINDLVRSRLAPNERMYLVGNPTRTIYAIEPPNLLLAERWASVAPTSGGIAAGGTAVELALSFEAGDLPFGEYSAALVIAGNAVNPPPPLPLGLVVEGSPVLEARLTGYVGDDGGAGCGAGLDGLEIVGAPGDPVVLCLAVRNAGDTHLADLDFELQPLGIDAARWTRLGAAAPLAPGEPLRFSLDGLALPPQPRVVSLEVAARATDAAGVEVPGAPPAPAPAAVALGGELLFRDGFGD